MLRLLRTAQFDAWLSSLRDKVAKAQIAARMLRAQGGNFGDVEPVGDGVSEMRIHIGAGYRVYFAQRRGVVYVLLNGGSKKSQQRDIAEAKVIWAEIKRSAENG